ncbi:hypothetical protein CC85DRAFT_302311 [Cutaneotrichosporon oleaginosum]|uniref:Uncharacterized protein n=1 Tax=Cutaneotrichosporon oleaginosum TaxID=879819 RepID=A0A0J0XMW9_9TREE|nr:uncharacterized protein CC85DRAFT_302311 [Cutaneotrichosporon oleaginosum]KLT42450.1 hypothetical protein CC85DRAFT_302311 [Cutaneotrichosporon oleaginosum]TXT06969.1 hypothetical protein COLE_06300 [Cutaneotrichosporon oleaginosum]
MNELTRPRRRDGELFTHRRKATYKRIPLASLPQKDEGEPWLSEKAVATEWLGLFYNLAVSSSFGTFNGSHQLRTPAGLPSYLAYFAVIISMWTIQLHYDVRFQGNDVAHRLAKAAQITLYLYVGAASGGWDLAKLEPEPVLSVGSGELVAHDLAAQSFLTVSVVVAAHCGLLAAQYLLVTYLGKRVGRRTTSTRWSFASLVISCALFIAAGATTPSSPSRAHAKIALLFLGVAVNLAAIGMQALRGVQVPVRDGLIATQYGSLSLTMLGTGFGGIAGAFQAAITGVSPVDSTAYAQVFLAVGVIYFIWANMFANFHKALEVDAGRTWLWEVLHFPLHFCLLAFIAAMTNCVAVNVWSAALLRAFGLFRAAVKDMLDGGGLDDARIRNLALVLDRLDLEPDFATQYSRLASLASDGSSTAAQAITVRAYQYFAQIIRATCSHVGVPLGARAGLLLRRVLDLATSQTPDAEMAQEVSALIEDAVEAVLRDAFSGVLWLYPAAGGILIFAAARSVCRFHFRGLAGYVIHAWQMVGGGALCLLGLLCLGSRGVWFDTSGGIQYGNCLYRLVAANWGIAIVFLIYAAVQGGYMITMEAAWSVFHVERERRGES